MPASGSSSSVQSSRASSLFSSPPSCRCVAASRAGPLANLAGTLLRRHEWRHEPADLDVAISTYREALDLVGEHDDHRPEIECDLGLALQRRFIRFGEVADLSEHDLQALPEVLPRH